MKKIVTLIVAVGLTLHLFACAAITKKGTQCKRAPSPGSQYCWQHGGTTKTQRAVGMTAADVAKSRCKASTKSGTQCKRTSSPGSQYCWQHGGATTALRAVGTTEAVPTNSRCKAITKSGTQCKRMADAGKEFCWQHANNGSAPKTATQSEQNESNTPPKKPVNDESKVVKDTDRVQCDALTKTGIRCTRKAQPGSSKCWQHQ